MFGTDNPDLTAFRDRGGKAIVWHGWADQLITAEGTLDYYTRVQQQMGGAEEDRGVHPAVHGPRDRPLRRRRRARRPAGQLEALHGVGGRRQGAGAAARDAPRSERRPPRGRGRCARIRSSPSTKAAAARTTLPASSAKRDSKSLERRQRFQPYRGGASRDGFQICPHPPHLQYASISADLLVVETWTDWQNGHATGAGVGEASGGRTAAHDYGVGFSAAASTSKRVMQPAATSICAIVDAL